MAIVIACLFFLGINTVSTKLADPYGHDLDDLRILSHCKLMFFLGLQRRLQSKLADVAAVP